MRVLLPSLLLLLAGCPDPSEAPTTDKTLPPAGGAEKGAKGKKGPGADGKAPPKNGPPPARGFDVEEGEGIELSGTISYEGESSGKVRIDFLKVMGDNPPQLSHTMELDELGEWSVEVPAEFGDVRIVGFLDQTGDGPSRDDPAMSWPDPVTLGTEDVTGISLVLEDDPDLGDLTPGKKGHRPQPPEEGAEAEGESGEEAGSAGAGGDASGGRTSGTKTEKGDATGGKTGGTKSSESGKSGSKSSASDGAEKEG